MEKRKSRVCVIGSTCLRTASKFPELRKYLRSPVIDKCFRSICRNEEELNQPDTQEIAIERTWSGRSLAQLTRCLIGTERLIASKKVGYRIFARAADVMEGRTDFLDVGEDILLKDLCNREAKMWDDKAIKNNLLLMDDGEWTDRQLQHSWFAQSGGPDKFLQFLVRLSSKEFDKRLAKERIARDDSEYWASRLKGTKEHYEEQIEQGIEPDYEEIWDLAKHLVEPAVEYGEDQNVGRFILMQAFQMSDRTIDPETSALYLYSGHDFYGSGGIWYNFAAGVMQNTYIISAFYRMLHAGLIVPASVETLRETIRFIRRPIFLRRMIALMEACSILDSNLAAKFFRVARLGIEMDPHQPVESMDLIIIYDILSKAIHRLLRPLFHVVKQAVARPLETSEQTLCTEVTHLVSTICHQTGYIKFSVDVGVQRWCVTKALFRYVSVLCMKCFVSMIVYDLRIAAGSTHGTYISHLFEDGPRREAMREFCLTILAELVQRCDPLKYETLEAFAVASVMRKMPVRASFIFELLDAANCGHYKTGLELSMSAKLQRAERILQLPVAYYWNLREGPAPVERVGVVTNFAFYTIVKPFAIRNPFAPAAQTSLQNAERPVVKLRRDYPGMTRIVRGFPSSQVVAIGWVKEQTGGSYTEEFDIYICQRSDTSEGLINCLYALSGPDPDSRVEVFRDVVMKECLKQHVRMSKMLIGSYVLREEGGKKVLALHVLTHMFFYEFHVNWRYWFSPDPAATLRVYISDSEDQGPTTRKGLDNFIGYMVEEGEEWDVETVRFRRDEAMRMPAQNEVLDALPSWLNQGDVHEAHEQYLVQLDVSKQNLLQLNFRKRVDKLQRVTFSPDESPEITFGFKQKIEKPAEVDEEDDDDESSPDEFLTLEEEEEEEEVKPKVPLEYIRVIYMDDFSRERWRRATAAALNRTEHAARWRRQFRAGRPFEATAEEEEGQ